MLFFEVNKVIIFNFEINWVISVWNCNMHKIVAINVGESASSERTENYKASKFKKSLNMKGALI